MNLPKIIQTLPFYTYIENSKLENTIIAKPSSFSFNRFFSKIKLIFGKKIQRIFLNIKENNEEDNLIIDAYLKEKDFEQINNQLKNLVFILEKEVKEVILKGYVK